MRRILTNAISTLPLILILLSTPALSAYCHRTIIPKGEGCNTITTHGADYCNSRCKVGNTSMGTTVWHNCYWSNNKCERKSQNCTPPN